ncbi:hypothetical protein E4U42_003149 [Claviceps africana]|uniref:Uncharacterized protein n=1 Tax=Claviceps africana TaxID=83212 RepID=A0A8K0JD95_9HYPO|nr:hypothetical protein E4U42_003149 [Claviceps africana]
MLPGQQAALYATGSRIALFAPSTDSTISVTCNGNAHYFYCKSRYEHIWDNPCVGAKDIVIRSIWESSGDDGDDCDDYGC